MSMWNPIVAGRRASVVLLELSRRWCLGVEWKSRHRERLRPGAAPGAPDDTRAACRRCADRGETRLEGNRGPISVPKKLRP
jgi:hypothetical protein